MPQRLPIKVQSQSPVKEHEPKVLALGGAECFREARKRSIIEGEDDQFEQVEGLAG